LLLQFLYPVGQYHWLLYITAVRRYLDYEKKVYIYRYNCKMKR
jgi:hypothetical protein